jgi:hypothetical protein
MQITSAACGRRMIPLFSGLQTSGSVDLVVAEARLPQWPALPCQGNGGEGVCIAYQT